jgi:DNA-binding GntR family transcriptional regulator
VSDRSRVDMSGHGAQALDAPAQRTRRRSAPAAFRTRTTLPALSNRSGPHDELRVYRTIFESVMNQKLAPGTKLPEVALCRLFGVGRTRIRRVLQALAHDHIVDLRPNRGAVVAAPTPEETRQIFEARRAIEAALLPLAIANATKADLAGLRRQLRDEHAALHRSDQPAWVRLASAFHLQVASLARNAILQQYLNELVSRCSLIVALYEPPGNSACEHDEHARIVALMERGDAATALRVMDDHLRDLQRRICLDRADARGALAQMLGLG